MKICCVLIHTVCYSLDFLNQISFSLFVLQFWMRSCLVMLIICHVHIWMALRLIFWLLSFIIWIILQELHSTSLSVSMSQEKENAQSNGN